jgi:hypothetical protein
MVDVLILVVCWLVEVGCWLLVSMVRGLRMLPSPMPLLNRVDLQKARDAQDVFLG